MNVEKASWFEVNVDLDVEIYKTVNTHRLYRVSIL